MLPAFQLVFCDIFWIVRIPFERNVFIEKIHTKQSGDNPGWNRRPREKKANTIMIIPMTTKPMVGLSKRKTVVEGCFSFLTTFFSFDTDVVFTVEELAVGVEEVDTAEAVLFRLEVPLFLAVYDMPFTGRLTLVVV